MFLMFASVVALATLENQLGKHIPEQESNVNQGIENNDCDEGLAALVPHCRIANEITEAHKKVENQQSDYLVKSLHIGGEIRLQRSGPLQENHDED